ncbi:MAG: hypothetical protein QXH80_05085 [Candidatus Nanoarchaeia archaeon]
MKRLVLLGIMVVSAAFVGFAQDIENDDDDMPQPYTGPQPGTPEFKEMFGDVGLPEPYTGPQPGDPDFDPSLFPDLPIVIPEKSDSDKKTEEVEEEMSPEKLNKMSEEEKKQLKKDLDMIRQMKMALVKKLIDFRKKYGYIPYNLKEMLGRTKTPAPAKKSDKKQFDGEAEGLVPVFDSDNTNIENSPKIEPPVPPAPEEQTVPENELPLVPVKKDDGNKAEKK